MISKFLFRRGAIRLVLERKDLLKRSNMFNYTQMLIIFFPNAPSFLFSYIRCSLVKLITTGAPNTKTTVLLEIIGSYSGNSFLVALSH